MGITGSIPVITYMGHTFRHESLRMQGIQSSATAGKLNPRKCFLATLWCIKLSQLTRTSSKFVNSDPLEVGGDLKHISSFGIKTRTVSQHTSQVMNLFRIL